MREKDQNPKFIETRPRSPKTSAADPISRYIREQLNAINDTNLLIYTEKESKINKIDLQSEVPVSAAMTVIVPNTTRPSMLQNPKFVAPFLMNKGARIDPRTTVEKIGEIYGSRIYTKPDEEIRNDILAKQAEKRMKIVDDQKQIDRNKLLQPKSDINYYRQYYDP
ncbi:hypothetical protein SSS_03534 [Sarcoptes scabiei]|uniref:Uncharacterized protein n=1 Tax=Sarcoptes scabiei TaxID=52283 RepID=A0A834RDA0_SARSC|nr:hypothetical protein SSS_03534 [Sarcoptes scabiei]